MATPSEATATCFRDVSSVSFYSNLTGYEDWDLYKEDLQEQISTLWPSMEPETNDKWLDNENKVLTENTFAFITISEYNGIACIALVPRYGDCHDNLALGWCNQVYWNFQKAFEELIRHGLMSNGNFTYKKVQETSN